LNLAIDKGFAGIRFNRPNEVFKYQLKYSNAVFSAFKTHRQQNDLAQKLTDADGNLVPFNVFKNEAAAIIGKYNHDWLKTEYNTAVIRARQAANFKKFEEDSDLFPNLKWLPSTSIDKREGHIPFYNLVKPITDPFWGQHYPGNLWNCKCGITNTDEPANEKTPKANYKPSDGIDENPAVTGELFSKSNAYRTKGYLKPSKLDKVAGVYAKNELLIEIKTILDGYRKTIDPYKGLIIENKKLKTGKLTLLRKSVKEIDFHNADLIVKRYIPEIEGDIENWKYLGWANVEQGRHPEADAFLYYKTRIANKDRFINIILHKKFKTEVVYAILDEIDLKSIKKGLPGNIEVYAKK
jgi:hypothetical protein